MDQWSDVKDLFSNLVPPALSVISKAALTAVLYGLEYLVEKNSPCPCDPKWNAWHSVLAFIVPIIVLSLISMMVVPDSRRMIMCGKRSRYSESNQQSGSNSSCCRKCCFVSKALKQIVIPPVIWVVILLLDGDYYACSFAPSVNRTHGHQNCKEFCSLESSSSLREHCFMSRIMGSFILIISVILLVLLKFFPRCCYYDRTEEAYYKFKYEQALEKQNWNKMKEELQKMAGEAASMEAKELIQKLKLHKSNQGEQSSNQGEQSSNQGDQSSNQGESNPNEGEQSFNQTRDINADEADPSESSA